MRAPKVRLKKKRATLILAALAIATPAVAPAPAAADEPEIRFQLHRAYKPCGKKWAKRAARLGAEQLSWMLRREHRLYRVSNAGRTLMTLELLSTASFRACDVADHWARRETSVRVTYFEPDGATATRLFHFANDDIHFSSAPKLFAAQGRVLLRGVTVDGREANRWLPLEPLPALVAASRARPAAVLASAPGAGGAAPAALEMHAYVAAGGL